MTDPLGLSYIAGILWGYVLFYLWNQVSRKRGFLLLLFSPLVLIVVLRYSGTDTYGVYEVALWHTFRTGLPTGFGAGSDPFSPKPSRGDQVVASGIPKLALGPSGH